MKKGNIESAAITYLCAECPAGNSIPFSAEAFRQHINTVHPELRPHIWWAQNIVQTMQADPTSTYEVEENPQQ
jgi:hypothetical protein